MGGGVGSKIVMSAVVIVVAIPGLVIEPGPLSEMAALGVLSAIWSSDGDVEDAVKEAV